MIIAKKLKKCMSMIKKTKSIKSNLFEIGMTVLKKNSRDIERKVGKLNAKLLGKVHNN